MGIIQFDIRHPSGHRESAVVESERALIGSASHCDVRLPVDQAAYEHVLIEVIGGTLRAEAKVDKPPATVRDMPLTQSVLTPNDVLGIGQVRIFVTFVADAAEGAGASASKKKESSPVVQLGLIAAFGAAMYLLLAESEAPIVPPPTQDMELFKAVERTCPQSNPVKATALAEDQLSAAEGKRERMPFDTSEGTAAVVLYETAAACFKEGGLAERATEALESAATLKQDLTLDFRTRRLRLSHMLKVEDYEIALQDVNVLRKLTDGQTGKYVTWLGQVSKQLEAKTSKGKR